MMTPAFAVIDRNLQFCLSSSQVTILAIHPFLSGGVDYIYIMIIMQKRVSYAVNKPQLIEC